MHQTYSVEFLGGPKDGETLDVGDSDWDALLANALRIDGQEFQVAMDVTIDGLRYVADVKRGRKVLRLVGTVKAP